MTLEILNEEMMVRCILEDIWTKAYKAGKQRGHREVLNHLEQMKSESGEDNVTGEDIAYLCDVFEV